MRVCVDVVRWVPTIASYENCERRSSARTSPADIVRSERPVDDAR